MTTVIGSNFTTVVISVKSRKALVIDLLRMGLDVETVHAVGQ